MRLGAQLVRQLQGEGQQSITSNYTMNLSRKISYSADLLTEFDHFFNRAFKRSLVPLARRENSTVGVYEADHAWFLRTDLPGFKKSEISLKFEDGVLRVRAEREESNHPFQGPVERHLRVPENIDPGNITARLSEGVLEITLPKLETENAGGLNIEIN